MKDILKAFRGDPDEFEVTLPMKYLLGAFGIMLILVPISLYVMLLDDVSDQMFATFTYILVVDLVMMVFTDVLIVLIWCPSCFPKDQKRGRSNSGCAIQCLPMQMTSDSVCSVPTDAFKGISVGELSRRLGDLHDEDEQAAREREESSPGDKPACAVGVHKCSTSKANNPNLDQNSDFPKKAPVPELRFAYMRGPQQRAPFNPERRHIKTVENLTYRYAGEPSRAYEPNQSQSDTFSRHFSVPGPSQKGFWYHKKQQYLTADPQRSKGKENSICIGGAAQSRACEPNYANLDQSGASHGHVSIPVPSQDEGFTGYVKGQKNQNPPFPQQWNTELKQDSTNRYTSGVDQSNACERTDASQDQNRTSSGRGSIPVPSQDDGLADCNKGQKNPNPFSPQQRMTEQNSRYATGVNQSNACQRTDVSRDQNGTSSGRASREDGLRHRKRFWTEPQPCTTRDSTTKREEGDEANRSSESLYEEIKNMDEERNERYEVKSTLRRFVRLKRHNPLRYKEGVRGRLFATSSVRQSRTDDALELYPVSNESKQYFTAAWVFDDKNELPSNCDSSPSHKRSRSAPSNRTRGLISSPRSSDSSTNRLPIPACAGDSRHRVLHRLLATILTTGDDVIAAYPELENTDELEDAPKMEVEALPSGDYVMHITMRLTSKELQNFRSRRATNLKDSEFKKYLATLC